MTITKIITAAIITLSAASSFAGTKCDHKDLGGRFSHTNPPATQTQVVKTATTSTYTGAR
ncbi:hypothetical protein [Bdellovibrio bacteriovorus]|uniref:DUF680 domain-containing protein n=1 Tax=Bdellovibrio bacteriovorus TaxID=959 RepID=A0A150WTZ8_BDEBC|nr:hypothetical protein [Bdellovibrio bacteriovorus]KYG67690.1 hypothetical protein AZI85_16990 [Bdellovibrio bacteriovorus]KYG69308.1 hypothetical protein AZI87_08930 [Bdellovibrio bacteriovorus]